MLREHARAIDRGIAAADVAIVFAALLLADRLVGRYGAAYLLHHFGAYVAASSVVWYALLSQAGFYRTLRTGSFRRLFVKVLQTAVVAKVLNAAILFAVAPQFSHRVYLAHLVLVTVLLLGWKLLLRAAQLALHKRGRGFHRVLVVGTGEPAVRVLRHVEEQRDWGFHVVGCVQGNQGPPVEACAGRPVLGRLDDLVAICKREPVDEVVVALPPCDLDHLAAILPRLEHFGIVVRMALQHYRPAHSRILVGSLSDDDPIPVVTYYRASLDPLQLLAKRVVDLVGSALGLAVAACLFPFVAAALALESGRPVLLGESRVGQNGRVFTQYRFRTLSEPGSGRDVDSREPRPIARVGRVLRRTGLDALPQFWNVWCGEMSLVGTRAPTQEEVECFEEGERARLCVKPGFTGPWKIERRTACRSPGGLCRSEVDYVDNWSLWLDLKLLAKTVGLVARGGGGSPASCSADP